MSMQPYLKIKEVGSESELEILLGEGEIVQSGGTGGWAKIPRPRRRSLTDWQGVDGYEQNIPVIFDGLIDDESVEQDIERLEKLARRNRGEDHPAIVRISGPVPHTDRDWIIQDIAWGAADRRGDGHRVRQKASILFWEFVSSDITIQRKKSPAKESQERNSKGKKGKGKKSSNKTYTVKRGDTLSGIAARKLGDAGRWREIADLNDIRDPKKLQIGQKLRMP